MSSSDGESVFLTQSKFQEPEDAQNTDGILSDILDLEAETGKIQNKADFDLKMVPLSDISDEELTNASQDVENIERFLKPLNQEELDELLKKGLSKKTEGKARWAISLFETWQQNKKKIVGQNSFGFAVQEDILKMSDDELNTVMSFFYRRGQE
jgi:hypothetical protein